MFSTPNEWISHTPPQRDNYLNRKVKREKIGKTLDQRNFVYAPTLSGRPLIQSNKANKKLFGPGMHKRLSLWVIQILQLLKLLLHQ